MKTLLYLLLLFVGSIYALRSGRANAARMRALQNDLVENNLRGYLILAFVVVLVTLTQILNAA